MNKLNIFENFNAEEIIEDNTLPPKLMVLELPMYNKKEVLEDCKATIYNTYEEAFEKLKSDTEFVCKMECANDENFYWNVDLEEMIKDNQTTN